MSVCNRIDRNMSIVFISRADKNNGLIGKNLVECAVRTRSQPINKKGPMDGDMVKKIIDKYGRDGSSVKELSLAALCCLGFAGFFRFCELSNIQLDHLTLNEEFVKVFVQKSKTYVCRKDNYVYVSWTLSN